MDFKCIQSDYNRVTKIKNPLNTHSHYTVATLWDLVSIIALVGVGVPTLSPLCIILGTLHVSWKVAIRRSKYNTYALTDMPVCEI